MRVRHLFVRGFRGIQELEWRVAGRLVCLVGAGDSGKSTILEAVDRVLSPGTPKFDDADFHRRDTTTPIVIAVALGGLPRELLDDRRFGHALQGCTADGELVPEPKDGTDPVVRVRLVVDSSHNAEWYLLNGREEEVRPISAYERGLFSAHRLGAAAERDLGWGRRSALSAIVSTEASKTQVMIDARRAAFEAVERTVAPALGDAACRARDAARHFGVAGGDYSFGLDAAMNAGALTLFDDGVPLRLFGLGTRRLVLLGMERAVSPSGSILLADEIEQGLEPYRIRRAIRILAGDIEKGDGQALLTTHASVTIASVPLKNIAVVRRLSERTEIRAVPDSLAALVRAYPEALLGRRVVVCEGKTEAGMLAALAHVWEARHGGVSLAELGVVLVPGKGANQVNVALALASIGFPVLLFRDADVGLAEAHRADLAAAAVEVVQWEDALATESRVFHDVPLEAVYALFDLAVEVGEPSRVISAARDAFGDPELAMDPRRWKKDEEELRAGLARAASKGAWFKRPDQAERLGALLATSLPQIAETDLARKIERLFAWAYDGA